MQRSQRIIALVSACVFALTIGAVSASAQDAPGGAAQKPQAPASITGDLVRVDPDAKLIVVKPAEGADLEFTYNDKTEIVGAKGAAGLATMKDSRVTVQFTEDAKTKARTAVKIEVAPKK